MNEMIIEGKFINIKEDIAILNDEVDNYIENKGEKRGYRV